MRKRVNIIAVAPIIGVGISAAGTIAGLSQQSAAARRQGQAIANQELIARDNLIIKQQQLAQAKEQNERRFVREKAILDTQKEQASLNLEVQREQANLQNLQSELQITALEQGARQEAAQLISAAEAISTEAAGLNTEDLFNLANQFIGSREAAEDFLTQVIAGQGGGQVSQVTENLLNQLNLRNIEQAQNVRETTTTRTRVAEQQGNLQRRQADIIRQQGVLSTDYLSSIQDLQNRANDIAFRQASFNVDNVAAQNLAGLEAAKFAAQAELQTARGAANLEFRSQQNAFDAQRASIQQPNVFGSLAQIGAQSLSLLTPQQPVFPSLFGSTSGPTFGSSSFPSVSTSNLTFGGSFNTGL